jgi:hypothetical protein
MYCTNCIRPQPLQSLTKAISTTKAETLTNTLRATKHSSHHTSSTTHPFSTACIVKTTSTENRKSTEGLREKIQITYKGKSIKITADFSTETLKERRAWGEVYQALNENNFSLGYSIQQNYHSKVTEE